MLIYTLRPDGTSFWLPMRLLEKFRILPGAQLTTEQWEHPEVQELLERRRTRANGGKEL